jgi:hypothetical protein
MPIINRIGTRFLKSKTPPATGLITNGLFVNLDASNAASYPGTGITVTDLTGNGNTGTLTNGPTYSSSAGGCFVLDGTNDFINLVSNASLCAKTSAPITMSMWIYMSSLKDCGFFGKLTNNFGFDGYIAGTTATGIPNSTTNGTGVDRRLSGASSAFSINTWYFVTFITQITSTASSTKFYVNTTLSYSGAHGSDSYNESNALRLGMGYYEVSPATYGTNMNGRIGAFYFYTRELSLSEITQNFNATRTRYGV